MKRVRVIDSHTAGEPTRVVISGAPQLRSRSLVEMIAELKSEHDSFRSAVVCEPRGHEAVVGALLTEPVSEGSDAGVIYFNNVGYLGMCGHGTIGLVKTLEFLGRVRPGPVRLDTPVGQVSATLHNDGRVTITNVPSYRYRKDVPVQVAGYGTVTGDIAYGGNWFFLVPTPDRDLSLSNLDDLTRFSSAIRKALDDQQITGENGGHIDHIELNGPPLLTGSHGRNFVLCPGLAYDRSPCGTGTSAKLACLAADGKLAEGDIWRQESVIGSIFEGTYSRLSQEKILPQITGSAFITADSELIFDPADPFCQGILPEATTL